jgi:hypothetical protein
VKRLEILFDVFSPTRESGGMGYPLRKAEMTWQFPCPAATPASGAPAEKALKLKNIPPYALKFTYQQKRHQTQEKA